MRISELADRVGVPTSTVRYYERIGLLGPPARTSSGYRDYGEDEVTRLLFVSRARKMGLSCEQITDLVPIWGGTNCAAAHERVGRLIVDKQTEIAERIAELQDFAAQLDAVRVALEASPPPAACRTDLSCCVPVARPAPSRSNSSPPADATQRRICLEHFLPGAEAIRRTSGVPMLRAPLLPQPPDLHTAVGRPPSCARRTSAERRTWLGA